MVGSGHPSRQLRHEALQNRDAKHSKEFETIPIEQVAGYIGARSKAGTMSDENEGESPIQVSSRPDGAGPENSGPEDAGTDSPEQLRSGSALPGSTVPGSVGPGMDLSQLNPKELILAITKMNVGQKQQLALKGNGAARKILLRDPNIDVQLAIVKSPKTSEGEIEQMAGMAASAEAVLKAVFADARWSKSYRIKLALAKNPKTPTSIANRCLIGLTTHDLKRLSVDPNTKKIVAQAAIRMLSSHK